MNDLNNKHFPVSWDQFHRDSKALAWRLADKGEWSAIVAITRGGLVPAAIVARELNIRVIETICISSYSSDNNRGDLKVLKKLNEKLISTYKNDFSTILLVDDLVDTGATARMVKEIIPGSHCATVYAKPEGINNVDTFITEVSQDTWIFFPWDTGLQFVPPINPEDE